MSKYSVGIIGATGIVGRELMAILDERNFPVGNLKLFASPDSLGKKISFRGRTHVVEAVSKKNFKDCDFIFGCASSEVSKSVMPLIKDLSCTYIDNSSAFRCDPEIPLVVPEINLKSITKGKRVIANPNCTAIILAMALWPIHQEFGIERILVSTYQAVSGAGQKALLELEQQAEQYVKRRPLSVSVFPEQILFNVISHNSKLSQNNFNGEENKVMAEVKKIFSCDEMRISITCMRVPVMRAHVESVNVELKKTCGVDDIHGVLKRAKGIKIMEPSSLRASNQDLVLVGRVRRDLSSENGFHLLIAGDQLRKGAALNAVQIAEGMLLNI